MKFNVSDDCIGCGLCVETCPDVFSMTNDNVAVAVDEDIEDSLVASATEAMENCPVSAINQE